MRIGLDARHAAAGLGIATYLRSLAGALAARGVVEPVWLGSVDAAPEGVEKHPVPGPYPLLDGPVGRRHVRRLGVDAVHFAGNTGWRTEGPVPAVLTVHDLIFFARHRRRNARQRYGHAYVRWNIARAVGAAAEVTTGSATIADAVQERFGRRPVVIGHGVPFPETVRAPADPPYLMTLGGRDPRKGVNLAVEVANDVGLPLHVTGRAGMPEGFERDERVTVHGSLSRAALDDLIGGALALVYLSRDEGFGLPVIEAMAVGTPVVTGNAPATREVGGDAALLVDPGDPVASATAHVQALLDPARRALVSAAGREHARGLSWDAVAAKYEAVYAKVVA
jgi:glycosyltransferase involved in cell wall biosynthesis